MKRTTVDNIIGCVMIAAVAAVLFMSLVIGTSKLGPGPVKSNPTSTTVPPQEDEPGWDCTVHGNKRCN